MGRGGQGGARGESARCKVEAERSESLAGCRQMEIKMEAATSCD